MNKRSNFLLIALFAFVICMTSTCKDTDSPQIDSTVQDSIEMELLYSFPNDSHAKNGVYLWSPRYIEKDSSENIYVSDQKLNSIFKFDKSGLFRNRFGKKGEGPGDLINPADIVLTNNKIIVKEIPRVQFLNNYGIYIKSFKDFKGYHKIVPYKDGFLFALPIILSPETKLVDVLSESGKIVSSFGDTLEFDTQCYPLNYCNSSSTSKFLYVAFLHFPFVRKYSHEGKLLAEFRINGHQMQKKEKHNIRAYKLSQRGKRGSFKPVILTIRASEKGFYLLTANSGRVEILEFDQFGMHLKSYFFFSEENYSVTDFVMTENHKVKQFFLLQIYPKAIIDVYRPQT